MENTNYTIKDFKNEIKKSVKIQKTYKSVLRNDWNIYINKCNQYMSDNDFSKFDDDLILNYPNGVKKPCSLYNIQILSFNLKHDLFVMNIAYYILKHHKNFEKYIKDVVVPKNKFYKENSFAVCYFISDVKKYLEKYGYFNQENEE